MHGTVKPRYAQGMCLGDDIMLAGAAVFLAKELGGLRVPCGDYCYQSVCDMFRLHPDIEVYSINHPPKTNHRKMVDPEDPDALIKGFNHSPGSGPERWYRQFGIPFKERWLSSPVPSVVSDIGPGSESVVFIHDDPIRNFNIRVDGYRPLMTKSIFEHVPALKAAKEIHCMDSSFFQLVESMDTIEADLFYYPNIKPPYIVPFKHDWKIIL